jgi:hypothetical protein
VVQTPVVQIPVVKTQVKVQAQVPTLEDEILAIEQIGLGFITNKINVAGGIGAGTAVLHGTSPRTPDLKQLPSLSYLSPPKRLPAVALKPSSITATPIIVTTL